MVEAILFRLQAIPRLSGPWLLCIVLLATSLACAQAATVTPGITLATDSDSIYLGDSVIIEMEAVGILELVDTSSLFRDADLLRESSGTRIAVIEGRVVEVKLRRMEFIPRREGKIVFGPLQGDSIDGAVTSNTAYVNVLPAIATQWQPESDDLQIDISLSDDNGKSTSSTDPMPFSVYVGQRIVADITLRHRHPIADEQLTLPDFDGFDVLPEYEIRRTVETRTPTSFAPDKSADSTVNSNNGDARMANSENSSEDSVRWRVIKWRYHLFAQRSGQHTITSVAWRGVAIRSRTQRAEFARQTPLLLLTVKPSAEKVAWWLPATSLSLEDGWSKDPRELSAGDEVFRTITLSATNVLASHLPDIEPLQSRAISSTAIEQTREQALVNGRIQATATFRYRLVAQSPIPVFLDTVRVPWYDPRQSTLREAIIPARRINIGLPDRADLLAELALNDQWLDKLILELRSVASRFAFWHVSLAVLTLLVCILLLREVQLSMKQRRTQHRQGRGTSALPGL